MAEPVAAPRGALARLHRRLSGRGDTEHEQSLVRLGIVGLLVVYAVFGPMPPSSPLWWVPSPLTLAVGVWLIALAHFVAIVVDPAVREVRRVASMLLDHAGTILGMAVGGEATALLYPLLLWITLGHGFRYGQRHLVGSAAFSVVLFGVLVTLHPFWQGLGLFSIGLVLALVLIPGYCLRLLGHLHDARRRAEASSEAKSRFLATMSHELRTPLHAILGMAELLRGTALAPEQRDMAKTIHTAGRGLLNMIEDILDIARIEAGAERNVVDRFDLHALLHEIRDMLGHHARTKGLALRLRLDPNLVAEVEGPRRAVAQILINLVANAIKFTEAGEIRLEAKLVAAAKPRLALAVVDTGCGIPEVAQRRVFDSFTQVDDSTTRRHGGSGLGLAIVKRLVDNAGGDIELVSVVDHGTRFDVTLPVTITGDLPPPAASTVVLHGEPTAHQRATLATAGVRWIRPDETNRDFVAARTVDLWCLGDHDVPRRHGRDLIVWGDGAAVPDALVTLPVAADAVMLRRALRAALVVADDFDELRSPARVGVEGRSLDVLVADDHRINRQVVQRLLGQGGHRAVLVESGEAALARLDETVFDVVVLDLNMPGMGGMAAAERLAARAGRPRLVALTADATARTREACLAAGFDTFLTKPVDGTRLLAAIEETEPERAPPVAVAAAAAPASGVIDTARIAMLRQLDEGDDFVREIITGFIADGRDLVGDIRAAAVAGDVAAFRDATHALRSAATHLGATALFERCLSVKRLDEAELQARAEDLSRNLDQAFEQAARELDVIARAASGVSRRAGAPDSEPAAPSSADPALRAPAPAAPRAR